MDYKREALIHDRILWQENENGAVTERSVDVLVRSGNSTILLIIVGQGGSIDGYQDKYKIISEQIYNRYGATVVIASNPNTSWTHFGDSFKQTVQYVQNKTERLFADDYEIYVFGNSAGATFAACYAYEYAKITKLLLVNPPLNVNLHKFQNGLSKFNGKIATIVFGTADPSAKYSSLLEKARSEIVDLIFVENADHCFSGLSDTFIILPNKYLFKE